MEQILELLKGNGILELLPISLQTLILVYIGLKVLDFATGILKTWKLGGYRSSKMRDGVIRWCAELVAILFTLLMDMVLGLNFLTAFTVSLFVYKECGSLIENLGQCGVNFPSIIKDKIEILNTENKKEGE